MTNNSKKQSALFCEELFTLGSSLESSYVNYHEMINSMSHNEFLKLMDNEISVISLVLEKLKEYRSKLTQ